MPSFTGFAPTPNLGENYLGGVRVAQQGQAQAAEQQQGQQRLAQQAQQAQQQLQLESQKLDAAREQAALELQVRQQEKQQQMFQEQQRLEIDKAYKDNMIGLQKQKLQDAQAKMAQETQKAARRLEATAGFQKQMEDLVAGGMPMNQAVMTAAFGHPEANLPNAGYLRGGMPGTAGAEIPDLGKILPVEGHPDLEQFVSGKGSRQLRPKPPEVGTGPEIPFGMVQYGKRLMPDIAVREDLKERDRLVKLQEGDLQGKEAASRKAQGVDLRARQKADLSDYTARQKKIDDLDAKLHKTAGGKVPAPKRTPNPKQINHLKEHPETANQFDDYFGEGASDQYLK